MTQDTKSVSTSTRISPDVVNRISAIDTTELALLRKLSTIDTTDDDFGAIFKENPTTTLAAKGIEISPAEATRIKDQLSGAAGALKSIAGPAGPAGLAGPVGPAGVEVGVSVKVKVKF